MNSKFVKKILDYITNRENIIGAIFILIGIVFVLKLFSLQIINGLAYDMSGKKQSLSSTPVSAARGNILDRNGVLIATDKPTFKITYLNTYLKAKELNEMFINLQKKLKKRKNDVSRSLETYFTASPFKYGRMLTGIARKPEELRKKVNLHIGLEFKENETVTPKTIFEKLKEKYKIDDSYDLKDAFTIMCMRFETRDATNVDAVELATNVSKKTIAEIEELQNRFPGISTDKSSTRKYIDAKYISHVLGYYRQNDALGVEKEMDRYLKGVPGENKIEVNAQGQLIESLDYVPPEPGDNVILTIDMKLQKVAQKSLAKTIYNVRHNVGGDSGNRYDCESGAVVAMDPNTGEVLAMANFPEYDPNTFLKASYDRNAQRELQRLMTDSEAPMLNRAIGATYAPGSSYKPVVATAALEKGVISPYTMISDPGGVTIEDRYMKCLEGGHGALNLIKGLETSCNVYFYKIGIMAGINTIDKYAKEYGLGELTGIDLPGEVTGERSNPEMKAKYLSSEGPWGSVNTAMSSIGQLFNHFTPLQMAQFGSALATNGKIVQPHVIKKAIKNNGQVVMETKPKVKKMDVKKSTFNAIRTGMEQVVTYGTGQRAFSNFKFPKIKVAGKTGTAQTTDQHSDNAAFVCYAPADKPEIAIYVYLDKGVWGYNAAYVAKDILEAYFSQKNSNKNNPISMAPQGPLLR